MDKKSVSFNGVGAGDLYGYITLGSANAGESPTAVRLESFTASPLGIAWPYLAGILAIALSGALIGTARRAAR